MDKLESELKKWLTNKFKGERKGKNKIRVPIRHILRDSPWDQGFRGRGTHPPRASGAVGPPPESLKMWLIGTLILYFSFFFL